MRIIMRGHPTHTAPELGRAALFLLATMIGIPGPALCNGAADPDTAYESANVLVLARETPALAETPRARVASGPAVSGVLCRELVRQALLIAARDELRFRTCDLTLGEPVPSNRDNELIRLGVHVRAGMDGILAVRVSDARDEAKMLWEKDCRMTADGAVIYYSVLPQMERASRTEFVEFLTSLGLKPRQRTSSSQASAPEEVEPLLSRADVISQIAALRRLSSFTRDRGESPESLGATIRAYANLSLLTRHHWNATSDVFLARSLLYAERMLSKYGENATSRWHRAYARALGGLHTAALEDVKAIEGDQGEEPDRSTTAAWTQLIRPYCTFDANRLLELGTSDDAIRSLAHALRFDVFVAINDARLTKQAAETAWTECPLDMGIYYRLLWWGGLEAKRRTAWSGPIAFAAHLPERVMSIPEIPPDAKQAAQRTERLGATPQSVKTSGRGTTPYDIPHQIAQALRGVDAASHDELDPSWSLLARLIEEEVFVLIAGEFNNAVDAVATDLGDLVQQRLPYLARHPYRSYIRSFGFDPEQSPEEFLDALTQTEWADPRTHMSQALRRFWFSQDPRVRQFAGEIMGRCQREFTAHSIADATAIFGSPSAVKMHAIELQKISPHSPWSLRLTAQSTAHAEPEQLKEWEGKAKSDPAALYQVAKGYLQQRQTDDAIRCLQRAIQLSPHVNHHLMLADLYWEKKELRRWRQTLEAYLKVEDDSLAHARVQSQIANGLMKLDKWDEAEPYALASAATWSAWGMQTASQCLEGAGKWEPSEYWIRNVSRSYRGFSRIHWYMWCRRTGRGDLEAARRTALAYLNAPGTKESADGLVALAVYALLEERPEEALQRFRDAHDKGPTLWLDFHIALLADTLGKQDVLQMVLEGWTKLLDEAEGGDIFIELVRLGRASIQPRDGEQPEFDNYLKQLRQADAAERVALGYFVGRLRERQGNTKEAEDVWRWIVSTWPFDSLNSALAGWELARKHGTSR